MATNGRHGAFPCISDLGTHLEFNAKAAKTKINYKFDYRMPAGM